jgi:hypothetical protein
VGEHVLQGCLCHHSDGIGERKYLPSTLAAIDRRRLRVTIRVGGIGARRLPPDNSHKDANALRIKPDATSGWAMKAACEPSTDSVTAFILSAMKRSQSGGIALS